MKRFTDLTFESLPDDFKVIQPDSMVTFAVGVNQEVGVLVLFVVLYLTNVVGVALWVRTFCMVDDVVLVFFIRLILNFEPSFLVFGFVLLICFLILLMTVSPL